MNIPGVGGGLSGIDFLSSKGNFCEQRLIMNKRPKGPHIVHLSTMCHLFKESTRAAFLFTDRQKIQTWYRRGH